MHYEVLRILSELLAKWTVLYRFRVAVAVLVILLAHVLEVSIFSAGYSALFWLDAGRLSVAEPTLQDIAYFSLVTYTTLGYGDVAPLGPMRFYAGLESLTGRMLITWSASFTYLQMQKYWR